MSEVFNLCDSVSVFGDVLVVESIESKKKGDTLKTKIITVEKEGKVTIDNYFDHPSMGIVVGVGSRFGFTETSNGFDVKVGDTVYVKMSDRVEPFVHCGKIYMIVQSYNLIGVKK